MASLAAAPSADAASRIGHYEAHFTTTAPGSPSGRVYEVDFGRTLYWLPYALTWVLAKALPLELAFRLVVAFSVAAVPLGVLAAVRATGRPAALALLALPLTFNRAFFFGFHNFLLAVGLGIVGFLDDLLKIRHQRSLGLNKTTKIVGQALVAVGFAWVAVHFSHVTTGSLK